MDGWAGEVSPPLLPPPLPPPPPPSRSPPPLPVPEDLDVALQLFTRDLLPIATADLRAPAGESGSERAATMPAEPAGPVVARREVMVASAEYAALQRDREKLAALRTTARRFLTATGEAELARAELGRLAFEP